MGNDLRHHQLRLVKNLKHQLLQANWDVMVVFGGQTEDVIIENFLGFSCHPQHGDYLIWLDSINTFQTIKSKRFRFNLNAFYNVFSERLILNVIQL